MPRMRMVKPDLWTDKITGGWPPEVRDLFLALIVQADDHGRLELDTVAIRACVYSRSPAITDKDVESYIDTMVKDDRIATYNVGDRTYMVILRFYKHQRPQRRFAPKYPAPPMEIAERISALNGGFCPPEHKHICDTSHTTMVRGMGDGDGERRKEKGGEGGASTPRLGSASQGAASPGREQQPEQNGRPKPPPSRTPQPHRRRDGESDKDFAARRTAEIQAQLRS